MLLLGNRRFSWREIALPPSLLKKFFLKLSMFSKTIQFDRSKVYNLRKKYQISMKRKKKLSLVLLRTRSARRLSSQHLVAVSTPNITELVPSGFFCPQPWLLRRSEHIFPGKTPVCSCRSASCHGKISSMRGVVVFVPACDANNPVSILSEGMTFFLNFT